MMGKALTGVRGNTPASVFSFFLIKKNVSLCVFYCDDCELTGEHRGCGRAAASPRSGGWREARWRERRNGPGEIQGRSPCLEDCLQWMQPHLTLGEGQTLVHPIFSLSLWLSPFSPTFLPQQPTQGAHNTWGFAGKVGLSLLFPTDLEPSDEGTKCLQASHNPKVLQKDAAMQKTWISCGGCTKGGERQKSKRSTEM